MLGVVFLTEACTRLSQGRPYFLGTTPLFSPSGALQLPFSLGGAPLCGIWEAGLVEGMWAFQPDHFSLLQPLGL